MTKISSRLLSLTKYIDKTDCIADVGCDHGYLSIYLKENKLCKDIIASDVNQNALNSAINNIKKRNLKIKTYLSDGINELPLSKINTLVISGMGTSTILHILSDKQKIKNIKKLVLQSNNDHSLLRRKMNEKGYYLNNEEAIFDKGKWYLTMCFIKNNKKNTENEIEYGINNNSNYYKSIIDYYKKINKKLPFTKFILKYKNYKKIKKIKSLIK